MRFRALALSALIGVAPTLCLAVETGRAAKFLAPPASGGRVGAANRIVVAQADKTQPQATAPAQRSETINYENWILTCHEFLDPPKKRTCTATVALQKTETQQVVLAWTLQLNDQGRLINNVQTPTGVSIPAGIEIRLEKGQPRKIAFESCGPVSCQGSQPADNALVKDIAASASVRIVVRSSDGKDVNFDMPIRGFEKAYARFSG
jgi:invasion protein IalB